MVYSSFLFLLFFFCYIYGRGVDKDPEEGVKWLNKSAEHGSFDSVLSLLHVQDELQEDKSKKQKKNNKNKKEE